LVFSPFIISFIKREKVKQVILGYVEEHKSKAGTPTMGGIIFLLSISIISLICVGKESKLARMTVYIFIAYGIIGFLDDFIKFKFNRNLGLKAYQKLIFQLAISILIGYYVYKSGYVGSVLIVPFTKYTIDIGYWIIPFVALIYLATTNSVNLTDGLDGLASSTTVAYLLSFIGLMIVLFKTVFLGYDGLIVSELNNVLLVSSVAMGAMLSFLIFNCFPAKIFMGDTGSLALGSLVASVAVFSRMSLYIPIFGFMFVISSVSVIVQVAYYKLTRKRVFLMAPIHHHFQMKGIHEVRITICYTLVTILIGAVTILINTLV
jgi:phospho-N-acetylmuramoyl-pentapeptide-transferase